MWKFVDGQNYERGMCTCKNDFVCVQLDKLTNSKLCCVRQIFGKLNGIESKSSVLCSAFVLQSALLISFSVNFLY